MDRAENAPIPRSTLPGLFFEAIDRYGPRSAFRRFLSENELEDLSYRDTLESVRGVVAALWASGLDRGDRVAILSENRVEWALVDYGCLCAGVVPVPIYPTLTEPQIAHILQDSGSTLVFVSTVKHMAKVQRAAKDAGIAISTIVFDAPDDLPRDARSWEGFLDVGTEGIAATSEARLREEARKAGPDDVATLIYTSGTTGTPKGVMLTHDNLASNVRSLSQVIPVGETDRTVSFLPLSHVLQRTSDFLFFHRGGTIGYPRSLGTLLPDMRLLKPTVVVSVPRIYERIYGEVMDARGSKKKLVDWALRVADGVATSRLEGGRPRPLLGLQYRLADRLVFSKVKAAVGGHLRFFVSGGGPLAPELNRFFYSIGMLVLEGYGLTETSPVTNVNTMEHFRIGSVGRPIPGTEIKIAADGEILVRGRQVMKGYYKNPDATAEVIDEEGWLSTGDIGRVDAEGFLEITDRKKDILVTAGGKNVAPQPIENRLKTHGLIEHAVLVGDRRKFCSLLIVPARPALDDWAREQGIRFTSPAELCSNPDVVAHVKAEVSRVLCDLASFEKPKKIVLIPKEFTIENGFLTPKLSVKRRVVEERFRQVIDEMYDEGRR